MSAADFPTVTVFVRLTSPAGEQVWQRYIHPGDDHGEAVGRAARAFNGGWRIDEFVTFGEPPRYWELGGAERL